MSAFAVGLFHDDHGGLGKALDRFDRAFAAGLRFVCFARAEDLLRAAQKFEEILFALARGDRKVILRDVGFVRLDAAAGARDRSIIDTA